MWRKNGVWAVLAVLLAMAVVLALLVGPYPVALSQVVASLRAHMLPGAMPADTLGAATDTVIWNLRVPRMLAALLAGAALASAGAAYQAMFRNPLVSPDILGVSAGAGLGAVLSFFVGLPALAVQASAFVCGLLAVAVVYMAAGLVRRHDPVLVLVLAGVALSAFLGACISLLKILADPYAQLPTITFWLLGGLNAVSYHDLVYAVPLCTLGLLWLVLWRWRINVLSLSDEEARSLGMDTRQTRRWLIVAATLMTASVVSFAGVIGWVGLVIPHMARLLVGPVFARLLPASLLLGGAFMLFVDTLARSISTIELPLGVLTAIVGAPFFLFLLIKSGRQE